ncbi:binding-protein-dependent transport systems inner membrane component [Candidatus Vecturithrix granuli]|uniref:Binding-protein-dependent transport systems inner membrane component n=1 Tax=Vecturithrix granuli TaxID=1499967 RepID=A0A081C1C8_VECG1|nr:binding-protein-dependent transport systems inner membrane component [Candidatus Vecturithrix granuli]
MSNHTHAVGSNSLRNIRISRCASRCFRCLNKEKNRAPVKYSLFAPNSRQPDWRLLPARSARVGSERRSTDIPQFEMRNFFSGFPKDIEDAARIDGCSSFGILWQIILPSSWPALSVVIIWQFMISWNEFILALVTIESNEIKPLTLVPLIYSGQFMARPGAMFAILTMITVPIVIMYLFMQRYFVSTATGGAIKG